MPITGQVGSSKERLISEQVYFSVGGADIQILQERGVQAFEGQLNVLAASLSELSQQFRNSTPDRSRIQQLVDSLNNKWVPGVITGVIATVVSKALGL